MHYDSTLQSDLHFSELCEHPIFFEFSTYSSCTYYNWHSSPILLLPSPYLPLPLLLPLVTTILLLLSPYLPLPVLLSLSTTTPTPPLTYYYPCSSPYLPLPLLLPLVSTILLLLSPYLPLPLYSSLYLPLPLPLLLPSNSEQPTLICAFPF